MMLCFSNIDEILTVKEVDVNHRWGIHNKSNWQVHWTDTEDTLLSTVSEDTFAFNSNAMTTETTRDTPLQLVLPKRIGNIPQALFQK